MLSRRSKTELQIQQKRLEERSQLILIFKRDISMCFHNYGIK